MRYLCTNPDCSAFARLVAGFRPTCPACGQRVLAEKVMLKQGRTVESVIAKRGRAWKRPAPPPARKEESKTKVHRHPRRTWEQIKADLPPEKLATELDVKRQHDVARDNGIGLETLRRLMQEYGIVIPQRRGKPIVALAEEGPAVAEMMPESLAPAVSKADPGGQLEKPLAPPVRVPGKGGFQFQIRRFGEVKPTVVGDVDALAAAVEHLHDGSRYNLTVILEEAS